ncbi:sigma-70 family RNA polymerase sigma factor [Candidatus Pacearchaeota archaeon]|nr:sigma-70 family RNA polymerase sigma factor [Candidatus Pacearchaeota archaeon]
MIEYDLCDIAEPSRTELESIDYEREGRDYSDKKRHQSLEDNSIDNKYDSDIQENKLFNHTILTPQEEKDLFYNLRQAVQSYREHVSLVSLGSLRLAQIAAEALKRKNSMEIQRRFSSPESVIDSMFIAASEVSELYHANVALLSGNSGSGLGLQRMIERNAQESQKHILPWQPRIKTLDERLEGDVYYLGLLQYKAGFKKWKREKEESKMGNEEFQQRCKLIMLDTGLFPEQLAEIVDAASESQGKYYQTREEIASKNHKLIKSIVLKYPILDGTFISQQDLFQRGYMGLLTAIEHFDIDRGYKLLTYATWWIRQAISREIYNTRKGIYIPIHVQENSRKIIGIINVLRQRLGSNYKPSLEELAELSGLKIDSVKSALASRNKVLSFDAPLDSEGEATFNDVHSDSHSPSPDKEANKSDIQKRVKDLLNTISERERLVLEMRFGLTDGIVYTLEEIGEKYKVTRERIRQIEEKALKRLRHPGRLKTLGISRKELPLIFS